MRRIRTRGDDVNDAKGEEAPPPIHGGSAVVCRKSRARVRLTRPVMRVRDGARAGRRRTVEVAETVAMERATKRTRWGPRGGSVWRMDAAARTASEQVHCPNTSAESPLFSDRHRHNDAACEALKFARPFGGRAHTTCAVFARSIDEALCSGCDDAAGSNGRGAGRRPLDALRRDEAARRRRRPPAHRADDRRAARRGRRTRRRREPRSRSLLRRGVAG